MRDPRFETELKPEVENLATELADLFAAAKRQQTGQAYRANPRYRKPEIWQAAAEQCLAAQADPNSFVRAAFLYCAIPGGPFPQNMSTKAALRWYEQYKKSQASPPGARHADPFAEEVSYLIRYAIRSTQQLLVHATVEQFLLDDYFTRLDTIPAFVRLLILPRSAALRKKFGPLARREILGNPRLLELLKQWKWNLSFLES